MRFRRHLTYANVMATIAVFGVVAGGGAYAVSKIDTPEIANRAITAKKLDSRAVKTPKLRSEAVTSGKLADGAVETRNLSEFAPLAMAGVAVHDGYIGGWFNRLNDQQPTLEQTQPGVYHLRIPGIGDPERIDFGELLSSVNLIDDPGPGPQHGEVTSHIGSNSAGGDLHPIIFTFDSSGTPADRSFVYLVYRAEHS